MTKNSILSLRPHPVEDDVVAFGCRQGLVYIVSLSGKGKHLQKIRAHDEDIQGIDWSPIDVHDLLNNDGDKFDLPLAVSCRDKSVTIWSSKTCKRLAILKLQKVKTESPWITMKWLDSNRIFVSGAQGELCMWDFDRLPKKNAHESVIKSDGTGQEFKIIHMEHQKNLFNIACYQNLIFTCGYDRSFVCYNVKSESIVFNTMTFGG